MVWRYTNMDYEILDDYEEALIPDTDEIVTQADTKREIAKSLNDIPVWDNVPPELTKDFYAAVAHDIKKQWDAFLANESKKSYARTLTNKEVQ